MARETARIPFDEFSNNIVTYFDRVIHDYETIVVEKGNGEGVVMRPARVSRQRKAGRRRRTAADYEAFLSSFGGWSDVDVDEFLSRIYESRSMPPRPAVEL